MSDFADKVYESIGTTLISELRLTNTGKFIFDCKKDEVSGKWMVVAYRRLSDAGSNRTAVVFNIDHHSVELMLNQSKYVEYIQNQLDRYPGASSEKKVHGSIFEEDVKKLKADHFYDVYVEHNSKMTIDTILGARKVTFLCGCNKCVDKMRAVHKLHPLYFDAKMDKEGVVLLVDHDNSLNSTEEDMVNAEHLTFLCTCRRCKKEFYRIRDIRIKKDKGEPEK